MTGLTKGRSNETKLGRIPLAVAALPAAGTDRLPASRICKPITHLAAGFFWSILSEAPEQV